VKPPFRTLAVVILGCSMALASKPAAPVIYDPDPTQPGAGKLDGETWSKDSPTASLWLTRIDDATRTSFVRRRTGLDLDPFMTSPGRTTGGFMTFHVLVENKTETRLVFQPQACRLQTSWKDFQSPLDLPTILAVFAMADRPEPPGIGRIRNAILDGEIVLGPGERRDGLFIYHALEDPPKRFQIDIGATLTRGEAFGFTAYYRKRKQK
jgi:hypothetical protein